MVESVVVRIAVVLILGIVLIPAALAEERRGDALAVLVPGSGQFARDRLTDGSDCHFCPDMVVVPAGRFTMGSPASEPERGDGEAQVAVSIARPFGVGKFAVTFDQWDACVADGGCNGHKPDDQEWGRGKRPVLIVKWDDAKAYTTWLSRKTGKTYRLLSEAEGMSRSLLNFELGALLFYHDIHDYYRQQVC